MCLCEAEWTLLPAIIFILSIIVCDSDPTKSCAGTHGKVYACRCSCSVAWYYFSWLGILSSWKFYERNNLAFSSRQCSKWKMDFIFISDLCHLSVWVLGSPCTVIYSSCNFSHNSRSSHHRLIQYMCLNFLSMCNETVHFMFIKNM